MLDKMNVVKILRKILGASSCFKKRGD